MLVKNCANCAHARIMPGNLANRICRGAPPQGFLMGNQLTYRWPIVEAKDEGCGMFRPKLDIDSQPITEVKQ